MKVVIDIPEKDLEFIKDLTFVGGFRGNTKTIQSNVINAIRNGKPYEKTTSDLINRAALKEQIDSVQYTKEFCIEHQIDYSISMQMLGLVIDNAPTVDISGSEYFPYRTAYFNGLSDGIATSRPQGKWIKDEEHSITIDMFKCTICGFWNGATHFNFCPNCGAKMDV